MYSLLTKIISSLNGDDVIYRQSTEDSLLMRSLIMSDGLGFK